MKKTFLKFIRKIDNHIFENFGPKRIVFLVRNMLGWQCLLPIIEKLTKEKGLQIGITVEFEGCIHLTDASPGKEIFDKYYIPPQKAILSKWHFILLTNQSSLYFKRNVIAIHVNHGCCFGNSDNSVDATHFGESYQVKYLSEPTFKICFNNSYSEYRYLSQEKPSLISQRRLQFFISGLPKLDKLVNSSRADGEKLKHQLGLEPYNRTIVVGSHFENKSLLPTLGIGLVETLCKLDQSLNIIVMGHGRLWKNADGKPENVELHSSIVDFENRYNNFRFLPDLNDTTDLLRSADLFIGDNSSIFIEFCLVDKPILFFDHPEFIFQNHEVMKKYKSSAFCFNDCYQLPSLIEEALSNPNRHKIQRKETVDFFQANQGHASEVIADTLISLEKVCTIKSKKWDSVIKQSKASLEKHMV